MAKARGFFGIGIYHTKNAINIGTLWRTANILGAAFVFTVGRRYKSQSSDTMGTTKHVPLFHYQDFDDFKSHLPNGCPIVGVELTDAAIDLKDFSHPERAVYMLGAEDNGIPLEILARCHSIVRLHGNHSMNVSVAGSIVLYHRVGL